MLKNYPIYFHFTHWPPTPTLYTPPHVCFYPHQFLSPFHSISLFFCLSVCLLSCQNFIYFMCAVACCGLDAIWHTCLFISITLVNEESSLFISLCLSVCLPPSLSLSLPPLSPSPLASPPPPPFTTHNPTLQYLSVAAVGGRDQSAEGGPQFAQQETGASQGESPPGGGQWTVILLSLLSTALLDSCQLVGHLFCFRCCQQLPQ